MDLQLLKQISKELRKDVLEMTTKAKSGHPGGSLSIIDILTYLYFHKMNVDPKNPEWSKRDRLILSKGHACPALYASLSKRGFFEKKELLNLRKEGCILQGHPDKTKTPGIDANTGSLGQGLSIANGIALAGKLNKANYFVYSILGDGECQEGQIWEAAMASSKYKLDNIIAFIDRNRLQIDGNTEDVMPLEPFNKKWESFGWHVINIDGHNFEEIDKAVNEPCSEKPKMIICNTIKGKGVSFMENKAKYHGCSLSPEEFEKAIEELK